MFYFDDLEIGDHIELRYRFRAKPIVCEFLGFNREKVRFNGRRIVRYRMLLRTRIGKIVEPRTWDIAQNSLMLVAQLVEEEAKTNLLPE